MILALREGPQGSEKHRKEMVDVVIPSVALARNKLANIMLNQKLICNHSSVISQGFFCHEEKIM